MRLNTKIALAGLVSVTGIGLANMYEHVEAKQLQPTKDTTVVLNKNPTDTDKSHHPIYKMKQYPFGGK